PSSHSGFFGLRRCADCVIEVGVNQRSAIAVMLLTASGLDILHSAEDQPFGIERRIPWNTSRVIGSPDPPLPYTVGKTFTNINWRAPLYLPPEPDTDDLLVIQQGGEKERPSRILRVRDDP